MRAVYDISLYDITTTLLVYWVCLRAGTGNILSNKTFCQESHQKSWNMNVRVRQRESVHAGCSHKHWLYKTYTFLRNFVNAAKRHYLLAYCVLTYFYYGHVCLVLHKDPLTCHQMSSQPRFGNPPFSFRGHIQVKITSVTASQTIDQYHAPSLALVLV